MDISCIATHTGISLVRKMINYDDQLIAFDITGKMIKLILNSDIKYEVA